MLSKRINDNKLTWSIFLIWLFHVSAIIGIWLGFEDWFLPLTPLNLLLCFGLILWNIPKVNTRDFLILAVPFVIGMVAEILGVNFGLIFGTYEYGENLGWKVLGVPLTIGMNWSILVFATSGMAVKLSQNRFIQAAIAAALMVGLDLFIERVAPKFDFWEFENGIVPFQNYVGWFCVAFVANYIHLLLFQKHQFKLSLTVFLAFVLFFGIFSF